MELTCKVCERSPAAVIDPSVVADLPSYDSKEELLAAFPPSEGDSKTHRAAEPLAVYHLPDPVSCQFGGHEHWNGYVVRTWCKRQFQMGGDCAEKHIIGMPEMIRAHEKAEDRLRAKLGRKQVLRQDPPAQLDRFNRWLPFVEEVERFVVDMRSHLPSFYAELVLRAKGENNGERVQILDMEWRRLPKDQRRGGPNDYPRTLHGLEVLDVTATPREVRKLRDRIKMLINEVNSNEPVLAKSEDIYSRWKDLRKATARAEKRLARARAMFTNENMKLLAYAVGSSPSSVPPSGFRLEGTFFYVTVKGFETPVGLDLTLFPGA